MFQAGILKAPTSIEPGQFCVAKFAEDEHWYRAQVINTATRDGEVKTIDKNNMNLLCSYFSFYLNMKD